MAKAFLSQLGKARVVPRARVDGSRVWSDALGYRSILLLALVLGLGGCSKAPEGPYDTSANPATQYEEALSQAAAQHKRVLLLFGANWCPTCRLLTKEITTDPLQQLIAENFVPLYVNIGKWDANMDFVARFGKAVAQGIPSIAVADANGAVRFVTLEGEMAAVGQNTSEDLYAWYEQLVARLNQGPEREPAGG